MLILIILILTIFLILGLFLYCCVRLITKIEELEVKDEKREDKD
jgi:hypothetical protein